MNTKRSLMFLVLSLALVAFVATAWAGRGMDMMAGKANPKAHATLALAEGSIGIHATGLKPNSVYTVWLVNMMPNKTEAGAGSPPYMFKTDSRGKGSYEASLSESPFGKWQMVMVMFHPTGDPMDMKKMVEGLSAKVPVSK